MPVVSKVNRNQMQIFSLEQMISHDSTTRIIDLFCRCIDYDSLGFIIKGKSHEGKPAYEASTLTGIYHTNLKGMN